MSSLQIAELEELLRSKDEKIEDLEANLSDAHATVDMLQREITTLQSKIRFGNRIDSREEIHRTGSAPASLVFQPDDNAKEVVTGSCMDGPASSAHATLRLFTDVEEDEVTVNMGDPIMEDFGDKDDMEEENNGAVQDGNSTLPSLTSSAAKLKQLMADYTWLEEYENDSSRYLDRGRDASKKLERAKTLRAKMARLPALEERVSSEIREWEEAQGQPFILEGVSFLQEVSDFMDRFRAGEEAGRKRAVRLGAGGGTPGKPPLTPRGHRTPGRTPASSKKTVARTPLSPRNLNSHLSQVPSSPLSAAKSIKKKSFRTTPRQALYKSPSSKSKYINISRKSIDEFGTGITWMYKGTVSDTNIKGLNFDVEEEEA